MSALDSVLADLAESDRDCAYATVKREPLETLIEEWLGSRRSDFIALRSRRPGAEGTRGCLDISRTDAAHPAVAGKHLARTRLCHRPAGHNHR